jgi:flagellar P-ring protein FlgI
MRRLLMTMTLLAVSSPTILHATDIGDICRVKGQESNTLHGMGLVVGLPGTGDGETPTIMALSQTFALMGVSAGDAKSLKNLKNVALVHVTATIRPGGGQAGGELDVRISALAAKSLAGGQLLACPLTPLSPRDDRVFAQALGPIKIEDATQPTTGKITAGAKLVRDVPQSFHNQGYVTLVLDDKHAGFGMAYEVEFAINNDKEFNDTEPARAIDAKTVIVEIPDTYSGHVVLFVSTLTSIPMQELPREKRILINQKSGVIAIGDRVEILPVAISHKSLTIEVGGERYSQFVPLSPSTDTGTESLKALVAAMNALRVSTEDTIEIIKTLDRQGAIYGKLIIE